MHGRCTTYWDLSLGGTGGTLLCYWLSWFNWQYDKLDIAIIYVPQEKVRKVLASCPYDSYTYVLRGGVESHDCNDWYIDHLSDPSNMTYILSVLHRGVKNDLFKMKSSICQMYKIKKLAEYVNVNIDLGCPWMQTHACEPTHTSQYLVR